MANYKVVDADALDSDLTELSDAIRAKTGGTAKMSFPDGMKTAVGSIDTSTTPEIMVSSDGLITATSGSKSNTKQLTTQGTKTVTPTTSEQTAVASGVFTTGAVKVAAMPTATQATPSVSVDISGKITATATQTAGYVAAGTKTGTKQMTIQGAKEITPGTTDQAAVAKNVYTTGAVTVKGDANLKAENIAEGVSIFGVTGSFKGGGVGEYDVIIEGQGSTSGAYVEIDGVKYTSSAVVKCAAGTKVFTACTEDSTGLICMNENATGTYPQEPGKVAWILNGKAMIFLNTMGSFSAVVMASSMEIPA